MICTKSSGESVRNRESMLIVVGGQTIAERLLGTQHLPTSDVTFPSGNLRYRNTATTRTNRLVPKGLSALLFRGFEYSARPERFQPLGMAISLRMRQIGQSKRVCHSACHRGPRTEHVRGMPERCHCANPATSPPQLERLPQV